ncbi:MAG: hypothetical protein H6891_01460 [Brucellaceae bacterium]|nr:hypothetical protein [Brucellaceae bacterium]
MNRRELYGIVDTGRQGNYCPGYSAPVRASRHRRLRSPAIAACPSTLDHLRPATKAALINLAKREDRARARYRGIAGRSGFIDTPLTEGNPFHADLITARQAAAEHILAGLDAGRFEDRLSVAVHPRVTKLLRILPYGAYFAVIRRTVVSAAN